MYNKIGLYVILSFCVFFFTTQSIDAADKNRPNVIYIQASDLGKGLLSVYGQKQFTTPNIDVLVNNGVSFNFAYGGASTAFARVSLLTGYNDCTKEKWRITKGGNYVRQDTLHIFESENILNDNILFPNNDLYLPQVFGKVGYTTAQIGMLEIGRASCRERV